MDLITFRLFKASSPVTEGSLQLSTESIKSSYCRRRALYGAQRAAFKLQICNTRVLRFNLTVKHRPAFGADAFYIAHKVKQKVYVMDGLVDEGASAVPFPGAAPGVGIIRFVAGPKRS